MSNCLLHLNYITNDPVYATYNFIFINHTSCNNKHDQRKDYMNNVYIMYIIYCSIVDLTNNI